MPVAHEIADSFKKVVAHDAQFPFADYGERDSSWIISAADFLENCFPNSVLILCKIKHPEMAYVSKNCALITGYASKYLMETSPEQYFSLVHPEDQNSVMRLYERMELHTKEKNYRPENWRFVFHYRLRLKNQKYAQIRDEKAAFLHTSGRYVHYSILSVPDTVSTLSSPFMTLIKKLNNSFRSVDTYTPKTPNEILTRREQEVLKYLDAGLNTSEIAQALSVSPHTVRNHKSSLFKKAKAKTGLQAVRNARKLQWI
jgi:DNA-binding CsgD family transcriptional regulator